MVADSGHHRIVFLGGKGHQVVGEMGRMGDGPMSFDTPMDIAIDLDGYLYVLDTGNSRVQKFEMRWPG